MCLLFKHEEKCERLLSTAWGVALERRCGRIYPLYIFILFYLYQCAHILLFDYLMKKL